MASDLSYEGHSADDLRAILRVPRLELRDVVASTLDLAHELARSGAPAGTLVLADAQTEGRGRGGRAWTSEAGSGIWLTLLERCNRGSADLVSIRLGLLVAQAIDIYAGGTVLLKWPNDLYVEGGKLAGILVESRWRGDQIEWMAIGMGINLRAPAGVPGARGLRPGTSRIDVLRAIVPAMRAAAAAAGPLSEEEMRNLETRDMARGRRCSQPASGRVCGISADGTLAIHSAAGVVLAHAGSLVLEDEA
ncbi:MAG: biotin--[acetyl-CoA-carboxylase] ligase [Anaerolineae bacterium]|nr:biotin--[acetyl-CoA-carboxylase] ligase [Gemmatimonadaceae bacterium]